jgi:hypothetical protein
MYLFATSCVMYKSIELYNFVCFDIDKVINYANIDNADFNQPACNNVKGMIGGYRLWW